MAAGAPGDVADRSVSRLAPHAVVLRRSPTELQVGVDAPVVVPDRCEGLLRALAADGVTPRVHQLAARAGLTPHDLTTLLDALAGAGLLSRTPAAPHAGVRVVGCGPLGARTAHELASAGFGRLYLTDPPGRGTGGDRRDGRVARPSASGRASAADGRRARVDLLTASVRSAHPGTQVRRSRHLGDPEGDAVALSVVVADGPEPDRLAVEVLREQGAPHLLVRCTGDEAVVGPLVVPGTTSCARCADLARRDADPRWPWLLEQLTRTVLAPDPALLAWAAVTATVQALAYVEGGRAETLGHTLELGRPEHTLRLRAWPVHPECRCRPDGTRDAAPGTVGVRHG